MKKIIILLSVFAIPFCLNAQDFDAFQEGGNETASGEFIILGVKRGEYFNTTIRGGFGSYRSKTHRGDETSSPVVKDEKKEQKEN